MSFNCESGSQERLRQIATGMKEEDIQVALLQGLRCPTDFDCCVQGTDYKVFVQASGMCDYDRYAGTGIMIRNDLLSGMTIKKEFLVPARAVMLRVQDKFVDLALVSAYAPGDHLSRERRQLFWNNLGKQLKKIPQRSTIIMGIDCNGQIGRDGGAGVGWGSQGRWTENGKAFESLVEVNKLSVLNCLSSCKVTQTENWSWQRRDGGARTLIDFIAVSNKLVCKVIHNFGPVSIPSLLPQGCPIDHRPILVSLQIRPLADTVRKAKDECSTGRISNFNQRIVNASLAYQTDLDNSFRTVKHPVNEEALGEARKFVGEVSKKMSEFNRLGTGEEQWGVLNSAVREACEIVFLTKGEPAARITKKHQWLTDETILIINQQRSLWNDLRAAGGHLGFGWECKIKNIAKNKTNIEAEALSELRRVNFPNSVETEIVAIELKWDLWDASRRRARQACRKDKHDHLSGIVEEGIGVDRRDTKSIWKMVNRLAFKKNGALVSLKDDNGNICFEDEEQMHIVKQYQHDELKMAHAPLLIIGGEMDKEPCEDEANEFDITSCIRKTHPSRSSPEWSCPQRAWVMAEKEVNSGLASLFKAMGKERKTVEDWKTIKQVWIAKPGKDASRMTNRRGIFLMDPIAKAYGTWLQRRLTKCKEGNWGTQSFGGIKKRGSSQALLKVLSTIETESDPS